MAIRYEGTCIIHEYKGYDIKKTVKRYSQGDETFYRIDGVNETFWRLRDAKEYIDRKLIATASL